MSFISRVVRGATKSPGAHEEEKENSFCTLRVHEGIPKGVNFPSLEFFSRRFSFIGVPQSKLSFCTRSSVFPLTSF